jgi:hypothetical protein
VRTEACHASIVHAIVAFDEDTLIKFHAPHILPLLTLVMTDAVRLTRFSFSIYKCHREDIMLQIETTIVAKCERPVQSDVGNRTPDIDDLEAFLQELRGLVRRKMLVNASDRSSCRLVDVYLNSGLAFSKGIFLLARLAAANGVIEYDNSVGSCQFFDEVYALLVIALFDELIISKVGDLSRFPEELKTGVVDSKLFLPAPDILYVDWFNIYGIVALSVTVRICIHVVVDSSVVGWGHDELEVGSDCVGNWNRHD